METTPKHCPLPQLPPPHPPALTTSKSPPRSVQAPTWPPSPPPWSHSNCDAQAPGAPSVSIPLLTWRTGQNAKLASSTTAQRCLETQPRSAGKPTRSDTLDQYGRRQEGERKRILLPPSLQRAVLGRCVLYGLSEDVSQQLVFS